MPLPSSSTSSSDGDGARAPGFSWSSLGRTALWFCFFLALVELGIWIAFTKTYLAHSSLRPYFWYGASYEVKLREMVNTPNLPANSVLYAGWINPELIKRQPAEAELTLYGMSFSANLSRALNEVRPGLTTRVLAGPGAPMSHTYGMYELDKTMRKTRVAMVGVTSIGVQEVLIMNRGSLFMDSAFPYFFPRFKLDEKGQVVREADSLINSADELRAALADPTLWQRQLDVMSAHDDGYRRFFFASDFLDNSVLGRFVRRGLAKHHQQAYTSKIMVPSGYKRDHEAPKLFRALLRQMVRELRAEHVEPIVGLFALQGTGNHLYELVEDILREDAIPYFNTFDMCRPDDHHNFQGDMHFVHDCDVTFARRTLELIDATRPAPAASP